MMTSPTRTKGPEDTRKKTDALPSCDVSTSASIRPSGYPESASAFVHRDVHMDFFCDSFWFKPEHEQRAKDWLNGFRKVVEKHWNGHAYQNYPHRGDADYRWMYWGEAYESLLFVKRKYDPENVLHVNQNIVP